MKLKCLEQPQLSDICHRRGDKTVPIVYGFLRPLVRLGDLHALTRIKSGKAALPSSHRSQLTLFSFLFLSNLAVWAKCQFAS